jgi:hypothetical protein
MHTIVDYLAQELQIEYDLTLKKNYSPPKIYSANGDLKNVGVFIFLIGILI